MESVKTILEKMKSQTILVSTETEEPWCSKCGDDGLLEFHYRVPWTAAHPREITFCDCSRGVRRAAFHGPHYRAVQMAKIHKQFHNPGIPPRFLGMTLQSYPGGKGKHKALTAAQAYIKSGTVVLTDENNAKYSQRGTYNSILFFGAVGVGKTGLVMPIAQAWLDQGKVAVIQEYYEFMAGLQSTYGNGESWLEYLELAQKVELLVLDDLGKLGDGMETSDKREKLFLLLNYRHSHMLPTLMTSNLNPEKLSLFFEERIASRIYEMAAIIPVQGADLRA